MLNVAKRKLQTNGYRHTYTLGLTHTITIYLGGLYLIDTHMINVHYENVKVAYQRGVDSSDN